MRRVAAIVFALLPWAGASPLHGAEPEQDHLRAAAVLVDRGEFAPAVPHLRAHLKANPDSPMIRAYLAELLMKCGDKAGAKTQYERFVADAADDDALARRHVVHVHTKLMEMAADADDDFGEFYHRGAALAVLAEEADDPEPTLLKAAEALKTALAARPSDPRPRLPLYDVQRKLDQPAAARQTLQTLRATLSDPAWTAADRARIRAAGD